MSYSRKIVQNSAYTKKGSSGAAIYLRVIIHRKKKEIHLGLSWPPEYFNKELGIVKPRFKNDPDVADYNLIITDAISKANEVFKYFRLTKTELTLNSFLKEYNTDLSKDDFITYYSAKVKQRLRDKDITQSTYDDHMKTLRKLEGFSKPLKFADIDEGWAYAFDVFMKKDIKSRKGDSTNDRWKHHKNVRTYLNLARKNDHIKLIYPYDYFTAKIQPGNWKAVYEKDVQKLWDFYRDHTKKENLRLATARLLFMIFTGLRRSDLDRAEASWLKNNQLCFIAQKNIRFGRETKVPMSTRAMQLWQDAIHRKPGAQYPFRYFSEQKSNSYLKKVAEELEIDANIHHHTGRHTFITLFLKQGGPIDLASQYAGHTTLQQTMTYNHPDEERRTQAISVMDNIIDGD